MLHRGGRSEEKDLRLDHVANQPEPSADHALSFRGCKEVGSGEAEPGEEVQRGERSHGLLRNASLKRGEDCGSEEGVALHQVRMAVLAGLHEGARGGELRVRLPRFKVLDLARTLR